MDFAEVAGATPFEAALVAKETDMAIHGWKNIKDKIAKRDAAVRAWHARRRDSRASRGVTLIEIIIVLAIVAILAAVAVPSVSAYIHTAKMTKLDNHAKTIYFAAQDYLTAAKNSGTLGEVNNDANDLPENSGITYGNGTKISEDSDDLDNLKYLRLSRVDQSEDDLTVQTILQSAVLNEQANYSVNIEYNTVTGAVFAVCYSEEASSFVYGTAVPATDVIHGAVKMSNREYSLREKMYFGYYGADSNKTPYPPGSQLSMERVDLVNNNRLYVRWTDAMPSGKGKPEDVAYTIYIYDVADNDTPLLTVSVPRYDQMPTITTPIQGTQAITNDEHGNWFYKTTAGTDPMDSSFSNAKTTYFFVLDAIHNVESGNAGYSITQHYSELAYDEEGTPRVLYAKVRAKVKDELQETLKLQSTEKKTEKQNTLFENTTAVSGNSDSSAYEIAYARHLNNVRYVFDQENVYFKQTQNVSWKQAVESGAVVYGTGNGSISTNVYAAGNYFRTLVNTNANAANANIFKGTYDGTSRTISDIPVLSNTSQPAGLFSVLEGTLKNITLTDVNVTRNTGGTSDGTATGGLVGKNAAVGTLDNVTVSGSVTGGQYTGGVAGYNAGTVNNTVYVKTRETTGTVMLKYVNVYGTNPDGSIDTTKVSETVKAGTLFALVDQEGSEERYGAWGGFYKIKINSSTFGYVEAQYITTDGTTSGIVAQDGVYLYASASDSAARTSIPKETIFYIKESTDANWYKVRALGKDYYLKKAESTNNAVVMTTGFVQSPATFSITGSSATSELQDGYTCWAKKSGNGYELTLHEGSTAFIQDQYFTMDTVVSSGKGNVGGAFGYNATRGRQGNYAVSDTIVIGNGTKVGGVIGENVAGGRHQYLHCNARNGIREGYAGYYEQ